MADRIQGYGRVGIDGGSAKSRLIGRADGQKSADATAGARAAAADAVQITETASRLKEIEARLAELPDVDQARVEALRKRIESGDYQLDPQRIAVKLARMEQELAGIAP